VKVEVELTTTEGIKLIRKNLTNGDSMTHSGVEGYYMHSLSPQIPPFQPILINVSIGIVDALSHLLGEGVRNVRESKNNEGDTEILFAAWRS
jgi:hypothetical protein